MLLLYRDILERINLDSLFLHKLVIVLSWQKGMNSIEFMLVHCCRYIVI